MLARSASFPLSSEKPVRKLQVDAVASAQNRATDAAKASLQKMKVVREAEASAKAAWDGPPTTAGDASPRVQKVQALLEAANREPDGEDENPIRRTDRLGLALTVLLPTCCVEATLVLPNEIITESIQCVECAPVEPATFSKKHFCCSICMENCWIAPGASLALSCCNEPFCGECWARILETARETSSVSSLGCPAEACCKARASRSRTNAGRAAQRATENGLSQELIRGLKVLDAVPEGVPEELNALSRLLSQPRARRCPSCRHVQLGDPRREDMTCEVCSTAYCFHHGDAHTGEKCADYVRRVGKNAPDRAFARKMHTKRCPGCLRSVWKNGGCNHMRCTCGHDWQWSNEPVEVPCHCLNFRSPGGQFRVWAHPPCKGASCVAHAKLVAWRSAVAVVATPVVAAGAVVMLPILAAALVKSSKKSLLARRVSGRAAGLRPGTFEYNFYVHGSGRQRAPRPSLVPFRRR